MSHRVPRPALPVGHDFEGLVYLHGALSQERVRLRRDRQGLRPSTRISRRRGRRTFLQRMFQSYTALFIGYSHADVVMRYLARGLGPNAARFALADRTSDTNWEALGIVPVWFEVENGSWAQLSDTVQRWAERASMSLLDHRQRIAALVQSPPSAIPEDMSYLESLLGDVDTARLFTELASTAEWLTWANTRPEFGRLFNDEAPDDVTRTLAYWYAERFVLSSEELNSAALDVLAAHHGRLSAACASAIGHWLHNAHVEGVPRPAWLDRWLPFLLQANSGTTTGGNLPFEHRSGLTTGMRRCSFSTT
ncbi:MAG: SIR2 family protein [Microthrixaceae bacterium]